MFMNDVIAYLTPTGWLFVGVLGLLTFTSCIARILKWRVAHNQPHAVIDNLKSRIDAWWWMSGLMGLAFMFGKTGVVVIFFLISFYALREFLTLVYTRRADHTAIAAAFYFALPVQYILIWQEWYGLYSIFIPVYVFLLLPILSAAGGDTQRFLERASKVQWGLMACVFCISHVPALLSLNIPGYEGHNMMLIAFLVIVVQGSDVLQYVWGKLLGRRKLAPKLSPSKTWEGLIGGVLCATLLGAALYAITPFEPWQAAGMALLISIMGFLGGLVMSAMKRDRGVKDWGHMIEGHGGILDRMDSIIFAAPVFFHSVHYAWTP